jgi:hypothetical protein
MEVRDKADPKGARLEGWKVGRLEGWKVGRLEGWKVGRLEGWKVGRLEGWKVGRLEWCGTGLVKIQAIKFRREVENVAMSMKDKLGGPSRGDNNVEAVFELLVFVSSKNVTIFIFPRECDMVDKNPDASHCQYRQSRLNQ